MPPIPGCMPGCIIMPGCPCIIICYCYGGIIPGGYCPCGGIMPGYPIIYCCCGGIMPPYPIITQVEWFFFTAYIQHWSTPLFNDALREVPQLMTWDDHDIFDGWGSYPVDLQFCSVFQVGFRV